MANLPQWSLCHQGLPRLDQPGRLQQGGAQDGREQEAGGEAGLSEAVGAAGGVEEAYIAGRRRSGGKESKSVTHEGRDGPISGFDRCCVR